MIASEQNQVKLLTFPVLGDARPAYRAKALVFSDPGSLQTLKELERIAPTGATVLIVGETGTGKELAARYIHEHSGVPGPFVAVNCAALSESLIDAELFGHEAGAFTGATHARAGWFEAANGGTLFLDEIGDMSPQLQLRLLRVLQERQVTRIGSRKPVSINVRIIAATNVELERAVEAHQFRRDLYYRLNVAAVKLLPLRRRRGDIPRLAQHFLETFRVQFNLRRAVLTGAAERALLTHSWPGNIRELENVIQVALIMGDDGVVDVENLRLESSWEESGKTPGQVLRPDAPDRGDDAMAVLGLNLQRLLHTGHSDIYEQVERLLLTTAFNHCEGNQVHTAKRLGVSRNVIRAQLKRFGLIDASQPGQCNQAVMSS